MIQCIQSSLTRHEPPCSPSKIEKPLFSLEDRVSVREEIFIVKSVKSVFKKSLLYVALFFSFSNAFAVDLLDIYFKALDSDPTFRQAFDTFRSKRQAIPQSLAALKPQILTTEQAGRYYTDLSSGALKFNATYNSAQLTLNMTQTIFNAQAWAQVKKAKASVVSALATFNDAAQNLMIRTAQAYFAVLLAEDTLVFAKAKKQANSRQLEQAQQRFNVGLDTITSVYEAKAAHDQSIAQVIAAQNDLLNKREQLRKLTTQTYTELAPLRGGSIPLIHPKPNRVQDWVDAGIKQNYKLTAARYNLQEARENIRVQFGAGLPTINLTSYGNHINNEVRPDSIFAQQHTTNANVSVQLNFPVYQGGLISANTKQARYDFLAAGDALETSYLDVVTNTRIAFNIITDGISKVKADRQTVISQKNSLESTQAQFEVGTRTMVDVTNAQQRLFDAQRQLASDQYDLVLAILSLKYLAGTLSADDLKEVNAWLVHKPVRKKKMQR